MSDPHNQDNMDNGSTLEQAKQHAFDTMDKEYPGVLNFFINTI